MLKFKCQISDRGSIGRTVRYGSCPQSDCYIDYDMSHPDPVEGDDPMIYIVMGIGIKTVKINIDVPDKYKWILVVKQTSSHLRGHRPIRKFIKLAGKFVKTDIN